MNHLRRFITKNPWLAAIIAVSVLVFWVLERYDPPLEPATQPASQQQTGTFESYNGCRLQRFRGNDGDSFRVRLPDGRTETFRLYFVDTPESAFRTYANGENNHKRISQQAQDLGELSPQQAVEVGKEAKNFTLGLLAAAPFKIYTRWDSPFRDRRYHAFVRVNYQGKDRWLHELLVERGLARIKTKGSETPDGRSESAQREHLRQLQGAAQQARKGAWAE